MKKLFSGLMLACDSMKDDNMKKDEMKKDEMKNN
jgi:hypothetical protein